MKTGMDDILFTLGIHDRPMLLEELTPLLKSGDTSIRHKADTMALLADMRKKGLVELTREKRQLHISLTNQGRALADSVASAIADSMIHSWHSSRENDIATGVA